MTTTNQLIGTSHAEIAVAVSAGTGPAVLLIHGNSSCKEVFQNQMQGELGRHYRMIAMDLPGHGASSNARDPQKTYCMPGYADTANEVLQVLGADSAVVIGWSLGGHIGIDMAGRHGAVCALMISGTPPIGRGEEEMGKGFLPSEHMGLAGQETFSGEEADAYPRATCGINAPFEDFLLTAVKRTDGRARAMMIAAFLGGRGESQRAVVERVGIPLAIVNGADEPFVNNAFLEEVSYANLWQNRVHLLDGIGHAPFWEAPQRFDAILERFLIDVAPV